METGPRRREGKEQRTCGTAVGTDDALISLIARAEAQHWTERVVESEDCYLRLM